MIPLTLLLSLIAPECDSNYPDRCSVALTVHEPAPYAGQLLTPSLAISLGQKAMNCQKYAELQQARTASVAAVKLELTQTVADIEKDAERSLGYAEGYRAGVEANSSPWYAEPAVVAGFTAILMVAVFIAVDRAEDL